jgi:hypothetical protein
MWLHNFLDTAGRRNYYLKYENFLSFEALVLMSRALIKNVAVITDIFFQCRDYVISDRQQTNA